MPLATLADGYVKPASVLKGGVSSTNPMRMIDDATLEQIHVLMRDVVINGSGRSSAVVGYDIGGKTGTAERSAAIGYSKDKNLVSYVGVLPMKNPEYITLVMIDEPKKGLKPAARARHPWWASFTAT